MINPSNLKAINHWWIQFPNQLKLITKIRFFASFGAGGVLYLTSLIFNNIGLSATEIGLGFTLSAILGTVTRVISGKYLNKNKNITWPLLISSFLSIIASFFLFMAKDTFLYLFGQSLIGAAAGIYWPTAEIAVPYLCAPFSTPKAYALVRTSEAIGVFLGVFVGSLLNLFIYFKFIYLNDIFCMVTIIFLIIKNRNIVEISIKEYASKNLISDQSKQNKWHKNTKIILLSIILLTTCLALIQVSLPLDFVKGGVYREAISKNSTSYIISFQLILLLVLQWPIGNWISNKNRFFGLQFSLINFSIGTLIFFTASYLRQFGLIFMFIGIIFCSLGISSFLPTSSDIVFKIAPSNQKGIALALLSQCFALGYFSGPLISGRVLDFYGNSSLLWLSISILCFLLATIIFKKKF